MTVGGVELDPGIGGDVVLVDSIGSAVAQVVKPAYGAEGTATLVDASHGLPVVDAAAEASLDAIEASATAIAALVAGTLTTKVAGASTATLTTVSAATSSTQLLASNSSARQRIIINDSTATLYVKYGSAASSSSYAWVLPPKSDTTMSTLVLAGNELFTGLIHGIWSSATGSATITEVA